MRDYTSLSLVMRERERPNPKVWQPWYMEAEGGGKELPSRSQREQRARERLTIQRPPMPNASPSSPGCSSSEEDEINVVDSPPPTTTAGITAYNTSNQHHLDYEDGPLDMSIKRRSSSPRLRQHHLSTPNTPSPPPYHPRPHYLPRPSVIAVNTNSSPLTSASTPPSPPLAHRERPLPPPYHHPHHRFITTATTTATTVNTTTTRRQVLQACPVDPEIDEHFRRSLGRDYHHLFATGPNAPDPSTDSVDDHFAKALGETWTKLQAERKDSSGKEEEEGGGEEEGGEEEEVEEDRLSPMRDVTITPTSSSASSSSSSSSTSNNSSTRLLTT